MQNLNKDKLREWEKEFDEEFPEELFRPFQGKEDVKSFISNLLSSYQQDLIKRIEEIKESVQKQTGSFKYDDCYDDILTIIRDKKIGKD